MDQIINENYSPQTTVIYISTFHKTDGELYNVMNSLGVVQCQNSYFEICCLSCWALRGAVADPLLLGLGGGF